MQDVIFKLLGAGILIVALQLVSRQLHSWKMLQVRKSKKPLLETHFEASQCRRRIQCSAMLGVLAVGMIVESWIAGVVARVVFGTSMLIVLGWMILLALLDILATTGHYRRMSGRYQSEQIRLEAKAKQILHDEEKNANGEDR